MPRTTRSRRRAGASRAAARGLDQLPFSNWTNPYPPMALVSEDELRSIHEASLDVLESEGINFLLPEARALLKQAGADVAAGQDDTRVRFDRNLIAESLARAPDQFTLHARNPAHSIHIGGNSICFSAVSSPPNVSDLDNGRRTGNRKDYRNLLKLTQSLNVVQFTTGHPVEPIDIPPHVRHLDATLDRIELTDRLFGLYSLGRERVLYVLEMLRIVHGISEEEISDRPIAFTNINANSPRQFDIPMLWGMIEMARRRQPVVVTPFTLAGAMAPVSVAGALVQQNAEALAGISFLQIVNPGTPCIYGGFTSNVDMKTGAPAFGTPEYCKAVIVGGQLARMHGLPYRSSNVNASNAPDVQSTYESQMSLWAVIQGGVNMVYHGAGWLEGGLCASYEKMIIDAEMIQGMIEFMKPVDVSPSELALDAIADVEPGGHYFGTAHTLERYENAFYKPMLSDWNNFENWTDSGSLDATQRANRLWKQLLREYTPPPLDAGVKEALERFIAVRTEQGGAPTY